MVKKLGFGAGLLLLLVLVVSCSSSEQSDDPVFSQAGPPANIYEAAKAGDYDAAAGFITAGQWDSQSPDGAGVTPLNYAAASGNTDIIQLMVDEGADVNQVDVHGNTPLSSAKKAGKDEAAQLLTELGATK